jgi:hypothetical protein
MIAQDTRLPATLTDRSYCDYICLLLGSFDFKYGKERIRKV